MSYINLNEMPVAFTVQAYNTSVARHLCTYRHSRSGEALQLLARVVYGAAATVLCAPCGVLYHTGAAICLKMRSLITIHDPDAKQQRAIRAWEHLKAVCFELKMVLALPGFWFKYRLQSFVSDSLVKVDLPVSDPNQSLYTSSALDTAYISNSTNGFLYASYQLQYSQSLYSYRNLRQESADLFEVYGERLPLNDYTVLRRVHSAPMYRIPDSKRSVSLYDLYPDPDHIPFSPEDESAIPPTYPAFPRVALVKEIALVIAGLALFFLIPATPLTAGYFTWRLCVVLISPSALTGAMGLVGGVFSTAVMLGSLALSGYYIFSPLLNTIDRKLWPNKDVSPILGYFRNHEVACLEVERRHGIKRHGEAKLPKEGEDISKWNDDTIRKRYMDANTYWIYAAAKKGYIPAQLLLGSRLLQRAEVVPDRNTTDNNGNFVHGIEQRLTPRGKNEFREGLFWVVEATRQQPKVASQKKYLAEAHKLLHDLLIPKVQPLSYGEQPLNLYAQVQPKFHAIAAQFQPERYLNV